MKKRLAKAISAVAAISIMMAQASVGVSAKSVGVATHRHMGYDTTTLVQKVKDVEGSWIRQDYGWQGIDKDGTLRISDYLKEYNKEAKNNGLNILAILGYGNPKYGTNVTNMTMPTKSDENYFNGYLDYVRLVATELGGTIDAYEVWNEPDTLRFNDKGASPEEYAELVTATCEIIREVDPTAKVLAGAFLGGTAGVNTFGKYDDGREYIYQFMTKMNEYKSANGEYPFDAMSVHVYPQVKEGEIEYCVDGSMGWFMTPLNEAKYDGDIWVTEWGFFTGSDDLAYTEEKQAAAIIRGAVALDAYNKEKGISGECIYYELVDSGTNEAYSEHNYGLYTNDMTDVKLGADALKTFNRLTADKVLSSYDDEKRTGWGRTGFLAEYTNASGKVYVAWDLNGSSSASMTFNNLGGYASVKVCDYQGNETAISGGSYTLNVGAEPKFIVCENQGASIVNVVLDEASGKIKAYGKGYLVNEIEVSICGSDGTSVASKSVAVDNNGNFRAEFDALSNGEYTVYAGKGELVNYGEYALSVNSRKALVTDVVTASTGLEVNVTATLENGAEENDVTILVLPENVTLENATFADYAYLGQQRIEGNEISINFALREGSKGRYKVYLSAWDAMKTSGKGFVANMLEIAHFGIEPTGQGVVTASLNVDTHGINVDKSVIIIAQYDKNKRLLKVSTSEPGVEGDSKTFFTDREATAETIKAFWWDGKDTVKPLSSAVFMD